MIHGSERCGVLKTALVIPPCDAMIVILVINNKKTPLQNF